MTALRDPAISKCPHRSHHQGWRWTALFLFVWLGRLGLAEVSAQEPTDAALEQKIIGVWEDHYQGKRTMTVNEDGTATMVVELQGWKAAVYASKLTFEMTWKIKEGKLHKRTMGGEPAGKVNTILKLMGDRTDEKILELTDDTLRLLDRNGKRQYTWLRIKSDKSARSSPPGQTSAEPREKPSGRDDRHAQ